MSESPLQIRVTESDSQRSYHAEWSTQRKGPLATIVGGIVTLILGISFLYFIFWLAIFLFAVGALMMLVGWVRVKWLQHKFKGSQEFDHTFDQEVIEDAIVVEENTER